MCRVCRDEKDVRVVLDNIRQEPSNAEKRLAEATSRNESQLLFEKVLVAPTCHILSNIVHFRLQYFNIIVSLIDSIAVNVI